MNNKKATIEWLNRDLKERDRNVAELENQVTALRKRVGDHRWSVLLKPSTGDRYGNTESSRVVSAPKYVNEGASFVFYGADGQSVAEFPVGAVIGIIRLD